MTAVISTTTGSSLIKMFLVHLHGDYFNIRKNGMTNVCLE